MTVSDIIAEPLDVHKMYANKEERMEKVLEMMAKVGLNSEHANRYAHEFSGGQRQRIGIARSLVTNPQFVVCDEPVSALDVSIQAQIINLLKKLQREMNLAYVFISHVGVIFATILNGWVSELVFTGSVIYYNSLLYVIKEYVYANAFTLVLNRIRL